MAEVIFESLKTMAEMVRSRRISAVELMEAHLKQIDAVNARINAIVENAGDQALEAARRADNQSENRGPLHGVPMTVKCAWDCAGLVNAAGTLGRKGFVAQSDATVIARMRAAGAIPIGVTNAPEFSFAFESDNLVYGRTNNPYDVTRSPGGSGGGGAAAIAAGCSPFEVGGDLGGSIRVPSHCCGIAGLKPTLGRVPLTGYVPGPFGITTLLASAGPMARKVEDLALTLPLLSGPDFLDAGVAPVPLGDPAAVDVRKLRVAWHTDNGVRACDAPTKATVEAAVRALSEIAPQVTETRPAGIEETFEIFFCLIMGDGGSGLLYLADQMGTKQFSPQIAGLIGAMKANACDGARFAELLARRDICRMRILQFFADYDVLLSPVCAAPAYPHGWPGDNLRAFSYTMAHNLSGCPGAVVRFGQSPEGMPIGVQVVAAPWREDVALAVAAHLEAVAPPHGPAA